LLLPGFRVWGVFLSWSFPPEFPACVGGSLFTSLSQAALSPGCRIVRVKKGFFLFCHFFDLILTSPLIFSHPGLVIPLFFFGRRVNAHHFFVPVYLLPPLDLPLELSYELCFSIPPLHFPLFVQVVLCSFTRRKVRGPFPRHG